MRDRGAIALIACLAVGILLAGPAWARHKPPPPPPPPPGPPVITGEPEVVSATDSSLQVDVTLDADGLTTTYYVQYGTAASGPGAYDQTSSSAQLAAAHGGQTVTLNITGLAVMTNYWYRFVAVNADGTVTSMENGATTNPPPRPWLGVARPHLSRRFITYGQSVRISSHVLGDFPVWLHYYGFLLASVQGQDTWYAAGGPPILARLPSATPDVLMVPNSGRVSFLATPDHNTRYSVRINDSNSPWSTQSSPVQVIVFPKLILEVNNSGIPYHPYTVFALDIHVLSPRYRPPRVYFYRAFHRRGPWVLAASARLRLDDIGNEEARLLASKTFFLAPGEYVLACLRRQPVRDMGLPFLDRRCGRRVY